MKSLKNFRNNALTAPNKVVGGAPNVGNALLDEAPVDLYPTGIHWGPYGHLDPNIEHDPNGDL